MSTATQKNSQGEHEVKVTVLFFGAARDAVGQSEVGLVLNSETTAAKALEEVIEKYPGLKRFGRSLLFAVNQEYVREECEVKDGDELAVFPPVSGGSHEATNTEGSAERAPHPGNRAAAQIRTTASEESENQESSEDPKSLNDFFELTTEPIDVGAVARRIVLPECGATVTLDGYAREWTKGRRTSYLIYEAYAPMALRELERLGRDVHARFQIAYIGIVHRTGRLAIGETSVVISVGAPHRLAAFEACEWAIRELKRTVPIWKKEVFEDGEVWVEGEAAE